MKKLLILSFIIPLCATAQLDFESNKHKLNFVALPEVESLLSVSLPSNATYTKSTGHKLPSFKLNKNNYREPVSMYDAMAAAQSYVQSDIQISIDPREYGVFGGNSSYSADASTSVKNIAYKEANAHVRPVFLPYTYDYYPRQRRSGFYVGYGLYGTPSQ